MSKLINLEVVAIEDGYAVLEAENGDRIEMDTQYLPTNLREGRFLRFVISHTDYNVDDDYEFDNKTNFKDFPEIPNGKRLAW